MYRGSSARRSAGRAAARSGRPSVYDLRLDGRGFGGGGGVAPPTNAYLLVRGQPVTVRGNEMLIRGQGGPTAYLQVRGQDVTVRGQDINFGAGTPGTGSLIFGQTATLFSQPITIFGA